eukprot:2974-Heterococcus_DN1.PRE.3
MAHSMHCSMQSRCWKCMLAVTVCNSQPTACRNCCSTAIQQLYAATLSVLTAQCDCVQLLFVPLHCTIAFNSYWSEPSIGVSVTERLYYRLYNLEPGYRLESYRVDSFLQQSVAALDARAVVPEVVTVTCVTMK